VTHPIPCLAQRQARDVGALPLDSELLPDAPVYAVAGRLCRSTRWARPSSCSCAATAGRCCQLYLRADNAAAFGLSEHLQLGDLVWARGPLFRTRKQKRALRVDGLRLLTKALRPLPGKALQEGSKVTDDDWRYGYRTRHDCPTPRPPRCSASGRASVAEIRSLFRQRRLTSKCDHPHAACRPMAAPRGRPFRTHHNALDRRLIPV